MVKINKSTRFALYSVAELSENAGEVLSVGHIAEKYKISEHHVAKVLQQLARAGVIRSMRGINGGFQIARDPREITLLDIVEIFEPRVQDNGCLLRDFPEACDLSGACRIEEVFNEIQEQAIYTLQSVTVATLISPKKLL